MAAEFTPRMHGPYSVEADPCSELHTWYFVKDGTGHRFARVLYRSEAEQIAASMEGHEELGLLREIVGELAHDGSSAWESSIRCVACGAYVGALDVHTQDCAWVKLDALRAGREPKP